MGKPRIAILYHFYPHYRRAILRCLAESDRYRFEFWGSHLEFDGIRSFAGDDLAKVHPITTRARGRGFQISDFWPPLLDRGVSAVIVLGNANILGTWVIAISARLLGKKVFYWGHGWLRKERGAKRLARNFYFSLAHKVLVYSPRAVAMAKANGFPPSRVATIQNSLDWDEACRIYGELDGKSLTGIGSVTADHVATLVYVGRLVDAVGLDLLLEAMVQLNERSTPVRAILVGDGPSRAALETLARDSGLDVAFTGAIYDEGEIAEVLYASDICVAPGKVGLTAIHSLSYGTPVITHGDLDNQMPEVGAVVQGVTGDFFVSGSSVDLADTIVRWLASNRDRADTRRQCRLVVEEHWSPPIQRQLIEQQLDLAFGSAK